MRTGRLCKRSKRVRKVHLQKITLFMIAILISASICLFGGQTAVSAHEEIATSENASLSVDEIEKDVTLYKSIQIEQGDTLWNIAETYMDDRYESVAEYVNVLKELNNLDSYDIMAGSYIMVCYQN